MTFIVAQNHLSYCYIPQEQLNLLLDKGHQIRAVSSRMRGLDINLESPLPMYCKLTCS